MDSSWDDGLPGSYRFIRGIGTDKRPSVDRAIAGDKPT